MITILAAGTVLKVAIGYYSSGSAFSIIAEEIKVQVDVTMRGGADMICSRYDVIFFCIPDCTLSWMTPQVSDRWTYSNW